MASRKYQILAFNYDSDLGITSLKTVRNYLDADNNSILPLSPLFLARVVDIPEQIIDISEGLRRITFSIGLEKYNLPLPYHDEAQLRNHLAEINNVSDICWEYIGESYAANTF